MMHGTAQALWIVPAVCLLTLAGGCADTMRSTVAPEYRGRRVPVQSIAVTGPGASLASQEFIAQGYKTVDIGGEGAERIDAARTRGVPFLAVVDPVDTSQSVWDGLYSFSMRVSDTSSGAVVWTSSGTFGQGGMAINQSASTENAMRAMVSDFAKTFPPATQHQ